VSDTPQGPGWWQASDGKWYPPEQEPGGGAAAGGGGAVSVDVGSAFSYGWNKFIANIGDILVIWLIVIAVQVVFNLLTQVIDNVIVGLIVGIVGFVVSMIVQIALIRIGLLITAGQRPSPSAAFDTTNLGPYVLGAILYGIGILIGSLLLCIGAIIFAFLFWFFGYYILDQNQDPIASFRSSFELTTKNFGTVGVYAVLAVLLSICTCGLAAPIVQIGTAYIYRNLNGQPVAP
jgi:uncharacterized membrane protein